MDRQDILKKLASQEDRILIAKIIDDIKFTKTKNKIQISNFLDIRQQELVKKCMNKLEYKEWELFGGYINAQRKCVLMYPDKLKQAFEEKYFDYETILGAIRIKLPNELEAKYTHRDYLGGLMKLGIKREKIGDILVNEKGADIIISLDILNYIKQQIEGLTRFRKSKIEIVKLKDLQIVEEQTEKINIIVSSMRLDNIISELIKTSRTKGLEIILSERVFVNFELETRNSRILSKDDIITIRGKGRFIIRENKDNTRSGKIRLEIEKYK